MSQAELKHWTRSLVGAHPAAFGMLRMLQAILLSCPEYLSTLLVVTNGLIDLYFW